MKQNTRYKNRYETPDAEEILLRAEAVLNNFSEDTRPIVDDGDIPED